MRKTFKILGIVFGILVLLLVAAAVALPLLVDPNDFKPRIVSAVKDATGRDLEIPGDIKLSVFPWLGAELGAVRLGNAPGFGNEPFASVEGVEVRVKLLPLLQKQVEIGKVVVEQPVIRLAKNVEGRTNWDDLAGEQPATETQPQPETQAPPDFSVDGVEIRNAHILYSDASAKQNIEVTDFSLETGRLELPADFPLTMRGAVKLTDPELAANFEFRGQVAADTGAQRFGLANGALEFSAKGAVLPVSPLAGHASWEHLAADLAKETAQVQGLVLDALGVSVSADVDAGGLSSGIKANGKLQIVAADLAELARQLGELMPQDMTLNGKAQANAAFSYDQGAGKATVPEFSAAALGVNLAGKLDVSNLDENANVSGELRVEEFSPGQLMVKLGQELPEMQDGGVLDKAALSATFKATPDSAVIENLRAVLDQSSITGRIQVSSFAKQALRFDLSLDQIDADRYLPSGDEPAATETDATPLDQVEIPAELVRDRDVVGTFRIGKLKAFDFNSTDVNIGIRAQNDVLRVHPAEAKFYGGGYRGDIRVDASGDVPALSVDEHVDRVQLAPMVKDFLDVENVSGTAKIDVKATARGRVVGDLRKTLDGRFAMDVQDGAIEGFNLWESIRSAYATFKGQKYESKAPQRTEFAELSATGVISKGVLRNDDLKASLPFLRVAGKGEIDIAAATMDYTVEATILKSPELSGGIEELSNTAIPVRLTGPITAPKVRPDVKGVLEAKAKAELKRKEQELRDEAKRKAEEEKRRLEDKLKNKLKDLIG